MTTQDRAGLTARALYAPAAARNRQPILEVLRKVLPPSGLVLEVASGTGEHAAYFAEELPGLTWQPSDPDASLRGSIAAHGAEAGLESLRPPLDLDATAETWPLDRAAAVLCVNLIHIAPWAACQGLIAGAARLLAAGGPPGPTSASTPPCAPRTRPGACATWRRSPTWRPSGASPSSRSSRCRPTT